MAIIGRNASREFMGHHYVPQRYLKNFQDPKDPGSIWLHDKKRGDARPVGIKNAAQAKNYYSDEDEKLLASKVEEPGSEAIERLIAEGDISDGERLQIAAYIGAMFFRVPRRRRKALEMMPGVLDGLIEQTRADILSLADHDEADPGLIASRMEELDAIHERYKTDPPRSAVDAAKRPWPTERIIHAIFEMSWAVLTTGGPQFFMTSDNPAFTFDNLGFAHEHSELSFPLSSTHALHGSWQGSRGALGTVTAVQPIVREFNRRLAGSAERHAFYHERAPWLLKILPKEEPYLSRVVLWPARS